MAPAQQSNPDGVVKIGKGRGFVIESQTFMVGRVIVTAAHCLPRWPPRHGASHTEERTFVLLEPLDAAPTIPVECLFVDPVADIAVLGEPDGQASEELYEASAAYAALIDSVTPFRLGLRQLLDRPRRGRVLSKSEMQWVPCQVRLSGRRGLTVTGAHIEGGMSGSPILVGHTAVGMLTIGDRQAANLAKAIAMTGNVAALVAELHVVEHQRHDLMAQRDALAHVAPQVDWRLMERRARKLLDDWRGLLISNTADARPVLRELLKGPLRMTPILEDHRRGFQFEGHVEVGDLLTGYVGRDNGVPGQN